ncbi:MAG: D-aminoacyl-tRNA deacylase [Thermomicrobiales bacterium]
MRALLQRVTRASVTVDGELISEIGTGFLILLGVTQDDTAEEGAFLAGKIANLRVFEDDAGAMNRSALDLLGDEPADVAMLVVSQFTLYADARKGRRPSFVKAARPEQASPLVDAFADELRALGLPVKQGVFGAEMKVELLNDGPVTIWLDTAELRG